MDKTYSTFAADPKKTNQDIKLLWVSVGVEDFLYNSTAEFMNYLSAKKINYKSLVTLGGHTWMNTKTYLATTAELLFK